MSTSISQPTPNPFRDSGIQAPPASSLERLDNSSRGVLTVNSEADSAFTDSSGTLFSLYLSHADKHDKDQAESWKAGADGILVFTGLFAAAIATFVVDSYKNLLPDSAGNSVVLLAQISQQIEGLSNGTHVPITAALAPFSGQLGVRQSTPPASAVWVNSLWFLSLVVSLFCALLATLQQRWARRYLQLTQPQLAVHKRGHIRSYFADGVTRFHMHVTVEAIPALLHISLFLFLTGLVISLFAIHHTVAYIAFSATAVCSLAYTAITVMPVVYHNSPYTSPFSTPAWYISRKTAVAVLNAVDWVVNLFRQYKGKFARWRSAARNMTIPSLPDKVSSYKPLLSTNMTRAVYEAAFRPNPQRDAQALGWTLDRLDEEGELVKFAAGIPGFSRSIKVKDTAAILEMTPAQSKLHRDLDQHITFLLIRSLRPGLLRDPKILPESVREQRVKICLEALYYLPHAIEKILNRVVEDCDDRKVVVGLSPVVKSVESWLVAERLSGATTSLVNPAVKIVGQCMVAVIASQPPVAKQSLSILMRHLKINDTGLNRYLDPFDSLLLKNLNHFLINTAQGVIDDADKQHHINIVLLTVRLAKRLKFEHAAQELRDQFERLRTWIQQHATGPPGKARENAEKLLSELSSLTTGPPPPVPIASGTAVIAHTCAPDTAPTPTSACHATGPPGEARENAEKSLSELSSPTTGRRRRPPPPIPITSRNAVRAHIQPTDAPDTATTPTSARHAPGNAEENAEKSLSELSSPTTGRLRRPPPPVPVRAHIKPTDVPDTAATPTSARHATGPPGNAEGNAEIPEKSLSELSGPTTGRRRRRPPPPIPITSRNAVRAHIQPTDAPDTSATPTSARAAQTPQSLSVQQPVSHVPNDAYILITSIPMSQDDISP